MFPLLSSSSKEELDQVVVAAEEEGIRGGVNKKRTLQRQLSTKETTLEAKWEKRRRQIHNRRRRKAMSQGGYEEEVREVPEEEEEERKARVRRLTDEDLDELRGSIELGFGFNEENGGHSRLRDTLPALDLYFAVNRQLQYPPPSPVATPTATSSSSNLCSTPSPRSPREQEHDSWKICSPGDRPQDVKIRLRQWAQIVACSVRQCRQCC